MPQSNIVDPSQLASAIAASQNYMLGLQYPQGYWWAELEANATMTAEIVLLHKIWGTEDRFPARKAENYLRSMQADSGGWELYYGDGGELSTSVETYMALKLLGVSADDSAMQKARRFILEKGGISKTRIFTKMHLALIGCYDWRGIPSIPPWVMLLPAEAPFSIYEMSSWARGSTVPLLVVFDQKPVFPVSPAISLDELYTEGTENVRLELPTKSDWSDVFVWLDAAFKFAEDWDLVPFRDEGIREAEKWILERQEATGDWGGIIPAMLNSLLALRCLNYDRNDPVVVRGMDAVDRFAIETEDTYRMQPCISPVWDTAWALRSLISSGLNPDHPALVRGGEWLLGKQILDYGDWSYKNPLGTPGGWAFEFDNRFYPDLDDTATVVMALHPVKLPNETHKQIAMQRAVRWIASMQCREGGWAAFDIDNDQQWLNELPYSDLKATIDPNTADVTARVLEMLGICQMTMPQQQIDKAIAYLCREQESDGSWFGRWGVNYIYGTSGALAALAAIAPKACSSQINRGVSWLLSCQNPDGGWGETCRSYEDSTLKGQGNSTPSQTSWALIGLLEAGQATHHWQKEAIDRGIAYLIATQESNGSWQEAAFTGTGFPCHFYLKYHMYAQYFPLKVLGDYQTLLGRGTG